MPDRPVRDHYEAQAAHRRTSLVLLGVLVGYATVALSLTFGALRLVVGALSGWPSWLKPSSAAGVLGLGAFTALALVGLQYLDSRWNGAAYILKRLNARPPELRDRNHRKASEVVERIRIASGLLRVETRIIPDHTINALALVQSDGTAIVGLTEGMLADFEEDELEAVAAHEIAHVVRGDAALMTFVCSIADFFERMTRARDRTGSEPESTPLPLSLILVRLLSRFVARERELLADAAAVGLGRNPAALARALFKANLKNTFVGDFHEAYSPIFMVAPEAPSGEGPKPVWADTHPPLMERVRVLAGMAHMAPEEIIWDVWRERARRSARRRLAAAQNPGIGVASTNFNFLGGSNGPLTRHEKIEICRRDPARREPAGRCPRCAAILAETDYEGVPILACRACGGKLVREEDMDRILIRREMGFDDALLRKAAEFRERFVRNPLKTMKINDRIGPVLRCPGCGYRLSSRPFNYQYFVPVERCLDCGRIWFDADELEVLQILVEEASKE